MCLEIGNKVAVLDDVLKGIVIAINGDEISIETTDGMIFKFSSSELVKVDVEQHELSKFSDINNALLKEKISQGQSKKSLFKKEKTPPAKIFTLDGGLSKITSLLSDKFQNICQSHQTDHLIIVATEALRKAENSKEVKLFVEQQTGLKIKILSGQEEAKAVVKGLQTDPMINDLADYFALDIGGGSLEIMEVEQKRVSNIKSLPLGAVSVGLANSTNLNLPLTPETQLKTRGFVRKIVQKEFKIQQKYRKTVKALKSRIKTIELCVGAFVLAGFTALIFLAIQVSGFNLEYDKEEQYKNLFRFHL